MERPGPSPDLVDFAGNLLSGRSEMRVLLAMSPQEPTELAAALIDAAMASRIRLSLYFADLEGRFAFLAPEHARAVDEGLLRLIPLAGGIPRAWHDKVDHFPNALWDIDRMLADGRIGLDLIVAEMSGAVSDEEFGYGPMIGYTASALASSAAAVAILRADSFTVKDAPGVSHGRFDAVIAAPARPAAPTVPVVLTEVQHQISRHVAALIEDGATLQLGIGSLPDAIMDALADKRDLGIHSGVIMPSLERRLHDGVVTGRRKSLDPGRIVATGILGKLSGSEGLLRTGLSLRPISKTHDPSLLAAHEGLWTINSALDIDLSGQVNAEYIRGQRLFSGGGQSDFVRAGHLSKGGGSVIALPSCTAKGQSRIIAAMPPGQRATSSAQDVDFVITEFGCADLRGKTMRERAVALVAVAHPEHRCGLQAAAEAAFHS